MAGMLSQGESSAIGAQRQFYPRESCNFGSQRKFYPGESSTQKYNNFNGGTCFMGQYPRNNGNGNGNNRGVSQNNTSSNFNSNRSMGGFNGSRQRFNGGDNGRFNNRTSGGYSNQAANNSKGIFLEFLEW